MHRRKTQAPYRRQIATGNLPGIPCTLVSALTLYVYDSLAATPCHAAWESLG
jgi:hypothetical protein